MNLIKIPNGEWVKTCCGGGHILAEVSTPSGYLRIRTCEGLSLEGEETATQVTYEIQRFGLDMLPLDADYPMFRPIPKEELQALMLV